jgi:dTDP-glucose 4,6-dehydratase
MRILVTGGFGFIGSAFIERAISEEMEVVIIDKMTYAADISNLKDDILKRVAFFQSDISNSVELFSVLDNQDPFEWVVNFAAESHVDRSILDGTQFILTNVLGVTNLLEYAKKSGRTKFLQVSTDEVYGSINEGSWQEESALAPRSPYSASKASAELICEAYSTTHGIETYISRCSNNFGPRQSSEKLIPKVISNIQQNKNIPIYGDGSNRREWIYVHDHINALMMIIKSERKNLSRVFNIAGLELSNISIVKKIINLMGASEDLIQFVDDRPGHDFRYSVSDLRLRNELGEYRGGDFENQIKETVNWYLMNEDWLARSESRLTN